MTDIHDTTMAAPITAQRNGQSATAADLAAVAFAGYAHFTAMQVRDGQVRGLDVHLQRLRSASGVLYGRALADDEVRGYLRAAVAPQPGRDFSLTATVYSPAGEFTAHGDDLPLNLLVRTSAASDGPSGPLRLGIVAHERVLPEIKHVGEIAKTWFLRQAVAQGMDDAAFIDAQGRISEATIWNLAFWDGDSVIWPQAAMLRGTTMAIVMRQLDRLGVPQRFQQVRPADVPALQGAVVMNSWNPGIAVRSLGVTALPAAPDFVALLHHAFAQEPLVAI